MSGTIPLTMMPEGGQGHVISVDAGHKLTMRLIEMGFTNGATVRVIKSDTNGPIIVSVSSSKYALGRGMAMKIMVTPAEG
ncbi:MAG: ferrous iron transport protein A [Thermoplasmata archaeon]|nr:ferrous iron transport protein A [Thermoplasmata archaeon]